MNPKKQLSRGDKCLQRVIDGKFKGDLWNVMEVIFDESDRFYLEETLIEAKNTYKKFKENEIKTFKDEIYIENLEEVFKAVKKSYMDLKLLQKEYDLGTPERFLIDKEFRKVRKINTEAVAFIQYATMDKELVKYAQI